MLYKFSMVLCIKIMKWIEITIKWKKIDSAYAIVICFKTKKKTNWKMLGGISLTIKAMTVMCLQIFNPLNFEKTSDVLKPYWLLPQFIYAKLQYISLYTHIFPHTQKAPNLVDTLLHGATTRYTHAMHLSTHEAEVVTHFILVHILHLLKANSSNFDHQIKASIVDVSKHPS